MMSTCCQRVYAGSFNGHPCGNKAKFELHGKSYCTIHYPPNVEAKRKARNEKWEAEWKAKSDDREKSRLKQDELERKAACFDDLYEALAGLFDECEIDRDNLFVRNAAKALDKARGRV